MRDWRETLEWYRTHQTTSQIGFDPDGMCLKVCRTARNIDSKYLTAKQAQDATPTEHRVQRIRNLRRGMVLYFDTVGDSNPSGHIVTMIGRVKGGDLDLLDDILVETNSVKANEVVTVRGSYFGQHWADEFKFGATILNGVVLDVPDQQAPKLSSARLQNFRASRPNWDVKILDRMFVAGRRDLGRKIDAIEEAVNDLPKDENDTRVKEFKEVFHKRRILKLSLLNEAIVDGRTGDVKTQRDKINLLIKTILR